MSSNNNVAEMSIIEENGKDKSFIDRKREEIDGLIEAMHNEIDVNDKSWFIRQIEIVRAEMASSFNVAHHGAI